MMLKRIKQGFSAPEGIWKPSLPLLCQGTLFSHPGSYKTIWISLTWDMVNQQHSRWSFCHPSLCYMILVTEWQVLEGRWLKYLTRVGPPWNHITWVKLASPFNSRLKTRLRTKVFPPTGDLALRALRPAVLHLPLCLQLKDRCLAFLVTLWCMKPWRVRYVRSLSCSSHPFSLFALNDHSLRLYNRPGHMRVQRWLGQSCRRGPCSLGGGFVAEWFR